jgi:hypothetical protein
MGRGSRRLAAVLVGLALAGAACSGSGGGGESTSTTPPTTDATTQPSPPPVTTQPTVSTPTTPPSPQPTDVAAWVAGWKGALQTFADDVSAAVQAAKAGDVEGLRTALGKIPADAQDVTSKLGDPASAPGGLGEDARQIQLLLSQAAAAAGRVGDGCTGSPGASCLADVAELAGIAPQLMNALQPFGVHIVFHLGS